MIGDGMGQRFLQLVGADGTTPIRIRSDMVMSYFPQTASLMTAITVTGTVFTITSTFDEFERELYRPDWESNQGGREGD
jgi:ABC-type lipopolysaccharide export system ATPase subunit